MLPGQVDSAKLRLCQQRAPMPGGAELERDLDRDLRHQGIFLVREELHRAHDARPAPRDLFSRMRQAIDVLRGRGTVWVERRRP
jgi:hypothetical protein